MPAARGASLLTGDLSGWRMAGQGGFHAIADGVIESHGGPGLLWYAAATFDDFVVELDWRLTQPDDNSGLFLRIPPLADDIQPAIDQGYEVQIDDRAYDPEAGATGSALHRTGAIYRLAPATTLLSAPVGSWNRFSVTAYADSIVVLLNGSQASRFDHADRRASGHIALQTHHEGSAVQFRSLRVLPLTDRAR
jgi:hypothetical protein